MTLSQFKLHLAHSPEHELRFVLPDGGLIEAHAHITVVGRVEKTFIDCGGTVRRAGHCSLQAWVAEDTEHRLSPGRLASIIEKAAPLLGGDDLEVEIEYQNGLISQFPVVAAKTDGSTLQFHLASRHTDCLAKEVCVPQRDANEACCAGGSC